MKYCTIHRRACPDRGRAGPDLYRFQCAMLSPDVPIDANPRLSELYRDLPNIDELERRYLLHVLEITKGNRTHTAEILGINRRTLYRMATRFKISLDAEFPH